eukprot:CAMPEP_0170549698 /NCGR_PEP_ID=MMETSP0211-20121228/7847_1 /TAXON_ID=311385 /ORGANISM="Pseudokeronopsis sp., Strain OXSARD2" /LENGTH=72 /DNA_ID=CAMNT_0010855867 /DNA_START=124 /DNA_END=342 /DNA_ORIENTATION=+
MSNDNNLDEFLAKKSNEELIALNKSLVEKLKVYQYKDILKEHDYIIKHRFSEKLGPHEFKYLFEQKQEFLKA